MCLIVFAFGASRSWPLVIASNRDEFLDRPTLPLAKWQTGFGHEIISGRDLRAGGTWLGATPGGRVAFLTNVREQVAKPAPLSRGQLVTRWLDSSDDAASFAAALERDSGSYGGFNLVIGDLQRNDWAWMTNKYTDAIAGWHAQSLPAGVYGLSNAGLDTPWPKTTELKRVLTTALAEQTDVPNLNALQAELWTALGNRKRAPIEKLPATGVLLASEEALSSAFVTFPENMYGTRSSTVLVVNRNEACSKTQCWEVQMEERTHVHGKLDQSAQAVTSSIVSFALNLRRP